MSYTKSVNYIKPVPFSLEEGTVNARAEFDAALTKVRENGRYSPLNPIYARATERFDHDYYQFPAPPLYLGRYPLTPQDDYVLRLPIKAAGSSDILLPKRLEWITPILALALAYQREHFPDILGRWCYVTVRSGVVQSNRDDELHVDGFQMGTDAVPRHIPEQSYLWANVEPAIFSMQAYDLLGVNPRLHNVHSFFQRVTRDASLMSGVNEGLYVIDPYHVHKRPTLAAGRRRSMVRITFSPVEIKDDTNTHNPFLPLGPYGRGGPDNTDARDYLQTWTDNRGWPRGFVPVQ